MRQRISVTLKRLPATVIAFTALVVALDGTFLVMNSSYVRERPLWAAFWVLLGLGLLAALVIWRQWWAWWLCLINPIAYLISLPRGAPISALCTTLSSSRSSPCCSCRPCAGTPAS